MSNSKNSKKAKGAIAFGSILMGIGSLCVGAGCYFGFTKTDNILVNNSNNQNNPGTNDVPTNQEPSKPNNPNIPSIPNGDENNDNSSNGSDQDNVSPSPSNPPVNTPDNKPEVAPPVVPHPEPSIPETPVVPSPSPSEPTLPVLPPEQNNNGNVTPDNNQNNEVQPPVVPPTVPNPPSTKPQEPGPMRNFAINVTRTSGFILESAIPYFDIFDADTGEKVKAGLADFEDGDENGILNVELPENRNYKIKIAEWNGQPRFTEPAYEFPEEVLFNKDSTDIKFQFKPVIKDWTNKDTFHRESVTQELWVDHDILGKPISLRENDKNGKMTIMMHMRTNCPNSIYTLNVLNSALLYPNGVDYSEELLEKVEVICFTNYWGDDEDTLAEFQRTRYPQFHFVKDPDSKFVNAFFPNDDKYPRTTILDYQGVVLTRLKGKVSNQSAFMNYVPKFARNGVK